MTRIISLYQQKTHYLEKFCTVNEEALLHFQQGVFDHLESFYQVREDILKVLQYIDTQIDGAQQEISNPSVQDREQIRAALQQKDVFVDKIIEQDLRVLSYIDQAKSEIIRELQGLKKSKTAISRYKSGNSQRRLDEKV